jgi:hypothetical protein
VIEKCTNHIVRNVVNKYLRSVRVFMEGV